MPNVQDSLRSVGMKTVTSRRPSSAGHDSAFLGNSQSPNGSHVSSPSSGPSMTSLQQLPPACGARQLSKLKRFLTTLQQFGADMSPEVGDHVRTLVLALVNSQLSVEEFHAKLQQATNFPLRPFVIPFLKANLPLLQRELLHCAHLARLSPHQYLLYHEHSLLHDDTSPPHDDFATPPARDKRKSPPDRSHDKSDQKSPESIKRMRVTPPSPVISGSGLRSPAMTSLPVSGGTSTALAARYVDDDVSVLRDLREINRVERDLIECGEDSPIDARLRPTSNGGVHSLPDKKTSEVSRLADDMRRVENLLENVVEMVDKCRSAVTSLRDRCQSLPISPHNHDVTTSTTPNFTQRAVAEAVLEVKRQAMTELRQAVADSELKATRMIAAERARLDAVVADARRHAVDELLHSLTTQSESTEACWNCGRKATETCSGCNRARYCGSFCQHRDWHSHHKICGAPDSVTAIIRTTSTSHSPTAGSGPGQSRSSTTSPGDRQVEHDVPPSKSSSVSPQSTMSQKSPVSSVVPQVETLPS